MAKLITTNHEIIEIVNAFPALENEFKNILNFNNIKDGVTIEEHFNCIECTEDERIIIISKVNQIIENFLKNNSLEKEKQITLKENEISIEEEEED